MNSGGQSNNPQPFNPSLNSHVPGANYNPPLPTNQIIKGVPPNPSAPKVTFNNPQGMGQVPLPTTGLPQLPPGFYNSPQLPGMNNLPSGVPTGPSNFMPVNGLPTGLPQQTKSPTQNYMEIPKLPTALPQSYIGNNLPTLMPQNNIVMPPSSTGFNQNPGIPPPPPTWLPHNNTGFTPPSWMPPNNLPNPTPSTGPPQNFGGPPPLPKFSPQINQGVPSPSILPPQTFGIQPSAGISNMGISQYPINPPGSIGPPVLPNANSGFPNQVNPRNIGVPPNFINSPNSNISTSYPPPPQFSPFPNTPLNINPGPSYQQSSNVSNPSLSLSSNHPNKNNECSTTVSCSAKIGKIIESNKLYKDIENKYGGEIIFQGNKFMVLALNNSIVDQMVDEFNKLIKQYSFDDNATWAYLENDGSYRLYDLNTKSLIEERYQSIYHELISPSYENYSSKFEFNIMGGSYILEFAKIGGVHRQKRKNVNDDTIRAVKRQGDGEDLNKNFIRNYTWKWKHEDGGFRDYEPDAIFLIEQSFIEFKTGKTKTAIVLIQGCNGKTYKLDFQQAIQFNEITNFKRTIQRVDLV